MKKSKGSKGAAGAGKMKALTKPGFSKTAGGKLRTPFSSRVVAGGGR